MYLFCIWDAGTWIALCSQQSFLKAIQWRGRAFENMQCKPAYIWMCSARLCGGSQFMHVNNKCYCMAKELCFRTINQLNVVVIFLFKRACLSCQTWKFCFHCYNRVISPHLIQYHIYHCSVCLEFVQKCQYFFSFDIINNWISFIIYSQMILSAKYHSSNYQWQYSFSCLGIGISISF